MNLLTGASLLALVKSIYYRVSERPDTDPTGHNQARKTKTRPKETKGDKRAIFSHGSFFFLVHTRGCRASLVTQQLSIFELSSLLSVITNNSAYIKMVLFFI